MNKLAKIISSRLWTGKIFIVVLLVFGSINLSFAQDIKVDINALIQETQKMSQSAEEMTLIWWIPEDFWRVSFEQNPNMTEAQIEEFIKVLHPYTMIVAVDGKIGSFGGVTYESESTIRNSIRLYPCRYNYSFRLRYPFNILRFL